MSGGLPRIAVDAGHGSFRDALDAAAALLVDAFADCALGLVLESGASVVRAARHRDRAREVRCVMLLGARSFERALVGRSLDEHAPLRVSLGERPEHADPSVRAFFGAVDPRYVLAAPVRHRGQLRGFVVALRSERPFEAAHETTVLELAAHLSVVAENTRLRADLARALERADEASRSREEFLRLVGDELRRPLLSMSSWLEALRSGSLTSDMTRRALDILDDEVRAQRRAVQDVLALSSMLTGRLRLTARTVDLAEIVTQAIASSAVAMEAKGVALDVTTAADAVVWGDGARLEQTVRDLVADAARLSPSGSTVHIAVEVDGATVRLRIRDAGPAPRDAGRLALDLDPQPGRGLGLAVAARLVEGHGGRLTAHAAPVGADIVLELPRHAGTPTAEPPRSERVASVVALRRAPDRSRPRVLLVGAPTDALTSALEGWSTEALPPRDALARLADGEPTILVTTLPTDAALALGRDAARASRHVELFALATSAEDEARLRAGGYGECALQCSSSRELAALLDRLANPSDR